MNQDIEFRNATDSDGNPTGGTVMGTGITITWQDGPLGRGKDRKEPTGAFVEGVLKAAKVRLEFYQESKYPCQENSEALMHVNEAIRILNERTTRREKEGVEGTHKTHATVR